MAKGQDRAPRHASRPDAVQNFRRSSSLRDRQCAASQIQRLATEFRPVGAQRLSGQKKYRIRQGNYRLLYLVDDVETSVTAVRVGHRRQACR
jgi:mRNA interferase RelE/StbE